MYISALKAVEGSRILMTAVCHEVRFVIEQNAQKDVESAVRSWLWDDVDVAFLIKDLDPESSRCLHHPTIESSSPSSMDTLFTLLTEQHRLLYRECFPSLAALLLSAPSIMFRPSVPQGMLMQVLSTVSTERSWQQDLAITVPHKYDSVNSAVPSSASYCRW